MQSPTSAELSPELLQDDPYILGPGDGLSVRFLIETELSGSVQILNDGTASLPLLGSVRLTGLTLSQASLWLQSLYARQLLRPDLQLSVTTPRPLRVAVVGEVERQGTYTLTTSESSRTEVAVGISGLPTLVDAIPKAGGITDQADLRQVVLQRRLPGDRPPVQAHPSQPAGPGVRRRPGPEPPAVRRRHHPRAQGRRAGARVDRAFLHHPGSHHHQCERGG